jgi:hypothetical protein
MSSTDQIHMPSNFDNGWGFYVDLESSQPYLIEPPIPRSLRPPKDPHEYKLYYEQDYEDGYDDYYNTYIPEPDSNISKNVRTVIARVSSVAVVTTVAITYVVLFVL